MEDQIYETDILSKEEKNKMVKWHEEEIGTDWEVNEDPSGEPNKYYILFFDLTMEEVSMIKSWEVAIDHNRKAVRV